MKIEGDYAIIETAEEAAVFKFNYLGGVHILNGAKLPRTLILEAITPKEGDAVFWWNYDGITQHELDDPPHYEYLYACEWHKAMGYEPDDVLKANALTAGKSIGELRELLAWARGES